MAREADIFLPQKEGYVVLDIESQGYARFCPIEISAVRFAQNGKKIDSFTSLVKPRVARLNHYIVELTGITNEMVKNAPPPAQVIPQLRDFFADSVIVGHAVGDNDIPIIDHFYREMYHEELKNFYVDTFYWAQKLFPDFGVGHYNLKALAETFGIKAENFHRAEVDCCTTAQVYQALYRRALEIPSAALRKILHDFLHKNDPKDAAPRKQTPRFEYNMLPVRPRVIEKGVVVKLWFARGHACIELRFYPGVPVEFEDFMDRHAACNWQEYPNALCVADKISISLAAVLLHRLRAAGYAIYRKDAALFAGFDAPAARNSKKKQNGKTLRSTPYLTDIHID